MNAFEFEITIQSKSGVSSWPLVVRCKQPDGLTIHSKETLELSQEDLNKLLHKIDIKRTRMTSPTLKTYELCLRRESAPSPGQALIQD